MTARDDSARAALVQIIRDYGCLLGEDPRRCEALLRDFCPNARTEVHLLVVAARAGVPKQLMASSAESSRDLLAARLARTLEEDYAVTPEAARWTIDVWAQALVVAVVVAAVNPRHPAVAAIPLPAPLVVVDRFVVNGDGTVTDTQTGLIWADCDNGSDINWYDARMYCAGKGDHWQLPTKVQLQGLLDAIDKEFTVGTRRVTPLIRLSGRWFWSSETNGSSGAWLFSWENGTWYSGLDYFDTGRALCVRRS